jgi:hypothetical protein
MALCSLTKKKDHIQLDVIPFSRSNPDLFYHSETVYSADNESFEYI